MTLALKLALALVGGGLGVIIVFFGAAAYGIHQLERETRGKRPTLW